MAKETEQEAVSRLVDGETAIVAFRGQEFEACLPACRSARVQMDIFQVQDDPARFYGALDEMFFGKLRECMARVPEEDGTLNPHGCSQDALMALVVATIQFTAKN